ncbi:hypothetical protein M2298_000329 [Brevibacillus sp. 1238]|nr:hypothetical protein [Brevibacillus sp. 1238]
MGLAPSVLNASFSLSYNHHPPLFTCWLTLTLVNHTPSADVNSEKNYYSGNLIRFAAGRHDDWHREQAKSGNACFWPVDPPYFLLLRNRSLIHVHVFPQMSVQIDKAPAVHEAVVYRVFSRLGPCFVRFVYDLVDLLPALG